MAYDKSKWSLEIHHIDVGGGRPSPGDATLFIVRYDGKIKRTALIDGGMQSNRSGFPVLNYLENKLGSTGRLDVMVNTHYDKDHLVGLTGLLARNVNGAKRKRKDKEDPPQPSYPKNPHPLFKTTRIYDLGYNSIYANSKSFNGNYPRYLRAIHGLREGSCSVKLNSITDVFGNEISTFYGQENKYYRELRNVKGTGLQGNQRQHVTQYVSDAQAMESPKRKPLSWLVGKEILWSSGSSDDDDPYKDGLQSDEARDGAPTMICVAANQSIISSLSLQETDTTPIHVETEAGSPPEAEDDGVTLTVDNACCLAFIVRFNNFRYYVGGDLPTEMENLLKDKLNPANDFKNRIIAMKASHHGACESTSEEFVKRLKPSGIFISCGIKNVFRHPHHPVIQRLRGADLGNGVKSDQCYLTGFHNPDAGKVTPTNHLITQVIAEFDKLDETVKKEKYNNDFNMYIFRGYKPVEVAGPYLWHVGEGKWEYVDKIGSRPGDIVLAVGYGESLNDGLPTKPASKQVFTVRCGAYFDAEDNSYDDSMTFTHRI
jgi:beta-lactamase superfamily II metal-dependent hydrolase